MTSDPSHWFEGPQRHRLVALARGLLGSRWEAEEVVHDCFVRAQEQAPGSLRSEEAWLVTLVRNLAVDRLRRRRLEQAHRSDMTETGAVDVGSTHSAEQAADLSRSAERALRSLAQSSTPAEAAAVLLHEVFEMEYAEIAMRCGKRADALRQMVHRSLRRTRKHAGAGADRAQDGDAAADALFGTCMLSLASRSPAPLYELLAPAITTAEAMAPMAGDAMSTSSATHCAMAQINGRFALVVMFEGKLLCALPVGVVANNEREASRSP
jgi:RNA polymerase sigma-70 factor (ECF subfamily)